MRLTKILILFLVLSLSQVLNGVTGIWHRYDVTAVANGVNGCANANGCWQINLTQPVVAKAAGLTQSLVLFNLPANGYVHDARIKSVTACTGTTTLTTTLGQTGSTVFFLSTPYDLKAAVSATNFTSAPTAAQGSTTTAAIDVVSAIVSTVQNIDQTTPDCAWTVWVEWTILP